MPKQPKQDWTHHKDGSQMQNSTHAASVQEFYFPITYPTIPGWFKGMEIIIREQGLWPANGLNAECHGCKCMPSRTDCCCHHLMFTQPNFVSQKSQLKEYIMAHGHICDFYPKFHCELNFIEQYWGAIKYCYWSTQQSQ